jgi:hypothetical protein
LIDKKDWDSSFQQLIRFNKQRQLCYWIKTPKDRDLNYLVGYPQNLKEYKPPESKCQGIDVMASQAVYGNQNAIKINQFLIFGLILTKFFLL